MSNTKLTVLVVDDDAMSRTKLAIATQRLGHEVQKAGGGAEAIELLRTLDVDVMMLDLVMPDIDGFDVLRAMNDDDIARPPTIVVSSLDDEDSIAKAKALGARTTLSKTFTAEELHDALIEHSTRD